MDLGSKNPKKKEKGDTSLDSEEFQDLVDLEFEKEYDQRSVNLIFYLMFFCSVSVNIDHGSLPACSEEIKSKMHILNFGFGALGTIVYFGLTLGSLLGAHVYSNSKYIKLVLMLSLTMMAVTLVTFTLTPNFYLNVLMRFLSGFCQIFTIIYVPLWADAFGNERQKSLWIAIFTSCSVVGIFIGYSLTSWMVAQFSWEYSFVIAAISTIPLVLSIALTDTKFLDIYRALQHRRDCRAKLIQDLKSNPQDEEDDQIDSSVILTKRNSYKAEGLDVPVGLANKRDSDLQSFLEHKSQISVRNYASRSRGGGSIRQEQTDAARNPESVVTITESKEEQPKSNEADSDVEPTFPEILSQLSKNSDYMVLMMTLSMMYFITAGVLFWTPNYLDQVLEARKEETVGIFSFVAATGPLSGFVVSGKVLSYLGGANTVAAQKAIMASGWLCVILMLPVPFVSDARVFGFFIWILLFCGAFALPAFTVIMLSSVPDALRGPANSIANTSYNFLGWMPPPAVYGLLSTLIDGNKHIGPEMQSRIPMAFVVYMMIVPTTMSTCLFTRKHKIMNQNKELLKAEEQYMKQALEQSRKMYES